jgi:uncharacterized membrane protein
MPVLNFILACLYSKGKDRMNCGVVAAGIRSQIWIRRTDRMTAQQEQEIVDALKSIDYSFKYLMQYIMVIAAQKLQISPVPFPEQPKPRR